MAYNRYRKRNSHAGKPFEEDGVTQAAKSYDGTVWLVIDMDMKKQPGHESFRWTIDRVYPDGKTAVTNMRFKKKDAAMAAAQKEAARINGSLLNSAYSKSSGAGKR